MILIIDLVTGEVLPSGGRHPEGAVPASRPGPSQTRLEIAVVDDSTQTPVASKLGIEDIQGFCEQAPAPDA